MTKPLSELSISEAGEGLRRNEFSVRELYESCRAVSEDKNQELNAYIGKVFDADEEAMARAQTLLKERREQAPLLCGIPLAMKDNILIQGKVASASSKMLRNYIATYDATVVKKLKEQGALFVGRTNMDEFALGGSTENSIHGVTKNPHDSERVAGGTSGGSAAAVAAHMALGALGTDTGGSVRNPASYCGVVGLKPTYGRVSRSGIIAAVSSFDQVGPLAKTVRDAQIIYDAIRGIDPLDSTSASLTDIDSSVKTVGVLTMGTLIEKGSPLFEFLNKEKKNLREKGFKIVDIEISNIEAALAAYYVINFAEVSTNLARFDGIRYGTAVRGETLFEDYVQSRTEGFGPEAKRRILLGTYVLSAGYIDAYYRKADALRTVLRTSLKDAFEKCDVIMSPTMPSAAFKIGHRQDPLTLYLEDVFTVLANLTGIPAISVPGEMLEVEEDGSTRRLPRGVQFMAPHGGEARLFTIGAAVTGETL